MDFELDDDQRLLKDSVSRILAARYGDFTKRRTYQDQPNGFDRAVWAEYAEAGILALPLPADFGGLGGGPIETMIVMEEFGRALAIEPWLTSSVLCGSLLRHGASPEIQDSILPQLATGTALLALAHLERASRFDLAAIALPARRERGHYVLHGGKSVVLGGGSADHLIVSARTSGAAGDGEGITMFLVDAAAAGVSRRAYATQDGFQAAEIAFDHVEVPESRVLGAVGGGLPLLTRGVDEAIAGLCSEAVGAMDALMKLTVGYLQTRKQFGVPIGSFQALQHRAVDMLVMLEQARSMAIHAALGTLEPDARRRRAAISAAKVQIGRSARFVGQQAVQLHGGIAMTMEYQAGHYFKRLTMIDQMFGDADHHLRQVAALGASVIG